LYHTEYYASQNDKQKDRCTPLFWKQICIAVNWFSILKLANKVMSSNSFPMLPILLPPLVQAVRNEFNAVLKKNVGKQPFQAISMGEGSATSLIRWEQRSVYWIPIRCGHSWLMPSKTPSIFHLLSREALKVTPWWRFFPPGKYDAGIPISWCE
jgi:hypothetical protein